MVHHGKLDQLVVATWQAVSAPPQVVGEAFLVQVFGPIGAPGLHPLFPWPGDHNVLLSRWQVGQSGKHAPGHIPVQRLPVLTSALDVRVRIQRSGEHVGAGPRQSNDQKVVIHNTSISRLS